LQEKVTAAANALSAAEKVAEDAKSKANDAFAKYRELEQLKKEKTKEADAHSNTAMDAMAKRDFVASDKASAQQTEARADAEKMRQEQNKLRGDIAAGGEAQQKKDAAAETHATATQAAAAASTKAGDDESAVGEAKQKADEAAQAHTAATEAAKIQQSKVSEHQKALQQNQLDMENAKASAKEAQEAAADAKKTLAELQKAADANKAGQATCKPACMSSFKQVKAGVKGQTAAAGKYGYLAGIKVYKATLAYAVREDKNWATQTAATKLDATGKPVDTAAAPAATPPAATPPAPAAGKGGKKA